MRGVHAFPFVALAAALLSASALGQELSLKEEAIKAVEAEQEWIRDILQRTESDDVFIIMADVTSRESQLPFKVTIPVTFTKEQLINRLVLKVFTGDMSPEDVAKFAASARSETRKAREAMRKRLVDLNELLIKIRTGNRPAPADSQSRGNWRLKDGYPRFKTKEQCATLVQKNTRAELAVGSSSISIDYADLHGSTKEVTHSFSLHVTFSDLGKATYNPGEESTFVLEGSWTWNKDGGGYTAGYPVLGYTGGVTILKAEPRHDNLSAADSAQLWLGRGSSSFNASDQRTITFKVPSSGKEFTLDMGVGNYGGAGLVTWAYEWVE